MGSKDRNFTPEKNYQEGDVEMDVMSSLVELDTGDSFNVDLDQIEVIKMSDTHKDYRESARRSGAGINNEKKDWRSIVKNREKKTGLVEQQMYLIKRSFQ
jgi:hypothetical protein